MANPNEEETNEKISSPVLSSFQSIDLLITDICCLYTYSQTLYPFCNVMFVQAHKHILGQSKRSSQEVPKQH